MSDYLFIFKMITTHTMVVPIILKEEYDNIMVK